MKQKKILPALCLSLGLLALPGGLFGALPAGAVTMDWDDLTDAQQEQAYKSLESENEQLRQQLSRLGGGSGSSGGGTGQGSSEGQTDPAQSIEGAGQSSEESADSGGGTAESAQQAVDTAGVKDQDTFLSDLAASFEKRQKAAAACSQDQLSQMSPEQVWQYRFDCAQTEKDFYDTYSGAQFDSMNVTYLCTEYCTGLSKQYKAEETFQAGGSEDEVSRLYSAGYYNRAYALVELHDYYGLDLADGYQNLKDSVTRMDNAAGPETRNASVDAATVTTVQDLLNRLGFLCGTPDGICGRQTVSCVERFQTMYGFEPADGLIDDELISEMQDIIAKQGG